MAQIVCSCGESFSDGAIPSPFLYHLVPDGAIDRLVDDIFLAVRKGEDPEAQVPFLILEAGHDVYKCPECGRLLVFWEHGKNIAQSYAPEK